MRSTPVAFDGTMIYALSSTVEVDKEQLSSLTEANLWDNTEKWVKKLCYWEIHGYDKNTLFHKFCKRLNNTINQEVKDNCPEKLGEFNLIEKEVTERFQLDSIHKAVLSVGYGKINICLGDKIYNFSVNHGELSPESKVIPDNVLGYSFSTNKHWHLEKADSKKGLTFKSFTFKKVIRNRSEFVQGSVSNFFTSRVIRSAGKELEKDDKIDDILSKSAFDEEKTEQKTTELGNID